MSLITEFESVVHQRVPAHAFRTDLIRSADTSSDLTVRAAALTYRASAHLNELEAEAACTLLDQGLRLSDHGNALKSETLAWWLLHTAADAHDATRRRPQRALELSERAARYAWSHGLDSEWAQTRTNHVYMLRAAGRTGEVVELVREIVQTPLDGHAAVVVSAAVADLYEWAGVPHLAIEAWPTIPEGTVNSQHLRQAYAHLTMGDLASRRAHVELDEQHRTRHGITRQDVATLATIIGAQITAGEGDVESALAAVLERRSRLATTDAVTLRTLTNSVAAGLLLHLDRPEHALELLRDPPPDMNFGEQAMIGAIRAEAYAALGEYESAYRCRREQAVGARQGQLGAVDQAELRAALAASRYGRPGGVVEARQRELRAALDERTQLTSLVAEDLRGPILSISLAADLLQAAPSAEVFALLRAATGTLELEVLALTDLDRFESEHAADAPNTLDIAAIVEEGRHLAASVVQANPVRVRHVDEHLSLASRGDLVSRIIAYILGDIVAHLPSNHELDVHTARRGERVSIVFTSYPASAPRSGSAPSQSHVVGNSARERFVVRRLVERLGGTIDDVSESDSLRRLVLMIPLDDQAVTPPLAAVD